MKIRIRGDFLRLRLTRGEVEQLARDASVEEAVHFGPGQKLAYRVETDVDLAEPDAELDLGAHGVSALICVRLPADRVERWASATDEVGIDITRDVGGTRRLRILVEKDFACLVPRGDAEDADAFPHPAALGEGR